MNLTRRFAYYFIGVFIGVVVLNFWVKEKENERGGDSIFPYGPNARTLRSFERITNRTYSAQADSIMALQSLDTADISKFFKYGEIDFSKSEQRREPCAIYWMDIQYKEIPYSFIIERCDSVLEIQKIIVHSSAER